MFSSKVAINICDPNGGVISKLGIELIDDDGCAHRLAGPRYPLAEQRLLAGVQPCLKLRRVYEPLASSGLPTIDEVVILRGIVDRSEPIKDGPMLRSC